MIDANPFVLVKKANVEVIKMIIADAVLIFLFMQQIYISKNKPAVAIPNTPSPISVRFNDIKCGARLMNIRQKKNDLKFLFPSRNN